MTKFEVVSKYKDIDIDLIPKRATEFSAGYDFVAAEDTVIPNFDRMKHKMWHELMFTTEDNHMIFTPQNNKVKTLDEMAAFTKEVDARPTLISTGVKCQLEPNQCLKLVPRSSSPLKYWLVQGNPPGIIDADYYNNDSNEGEIFFQVINLSPVDIQIKKGDKICQGIIETYETTSDERKSQYTYEIRQGGFGSTSA